MPQPIPGLPSLRAGSPLRRIGLCLWLLALLSLFWVSFAQAVDLPDLAPYQPPGWSAPIVISRTTQTTVDSCPIYSNDTLYLDWVLGNYGSSPTGLPSYVYLDLDGAFLTGWTLGSLPALTPAAVYDYQIPLQLASGDHVLTLKIDATNLIAESVESNNEFSKTITVLPTGTRGTLSSQPASYAFNVTAVGGNDSKIFTFRNSGLGQEQIASVSLSGSDAGEFRIRTDTCSGLVLPPPSCAGECASSCTVTVSFSPSKIGSSSAVFKVSDTAQTTLTQATLSGSAVLARGDVDSNGKTNLSDAILILQILDGTNKGPALSTLADVDGDAKLGVADALFVVQQIAKQRPVKFYELVRIQTNYGIILIWLYEQTPLHRDNFLTLARAGFYNNLIFHRVIDGFVVQGGDPLGTGAGGPGYTICQEINSSLLHNYGAVAAARTGDDYNPEKNSSGSQFYIVENSTGTHFLDGNYTVFGQVISGMANVETIASQSTTNERPNTPVVMQKVEVVRYSAEELQRLFGFEVAGAD